MVRGEIVSLHRQPVQPACRVAVQSGETSTPPKSDYNPSNKTVTLPVESCILILCFLHFISCVKPVENFFLFVRVGVQRLKYSSRYLRKVGKENKLQSPREAYACFLCAESRVISGPEPCPFGRQ